MHPNNGSISDSITTFFITCERQVFFRVGERNTGCCTVRKWRHEQITQVWRSDLQPTLEMLSQSVIINDETEHIVFAKHVSLEMLAE